MRSAFDVIQGGGTNVQQQIDQATSQAAERAQQAAERAQQVGERAMRRQGVNIVTTPTMPQVPTGFGPVAGGPVTIQTPDGKTTIIRQGGPMDNGIPPQVEDISIAFFFTVAAIIILLPLARAFARRMDRRSAPAQVPSEVSAQLEHLNRAVDAIALEVERISEGQRFTTRLLTDQRETGQSLTTGANR